jgi:Polyketide cyclase / dehydrase and lipid transport
LNGLRYSDGIAAARTMIVLEANPSAVLRRLPSGWGACPLLGGPEQVWRLWADVEGWPEWNGDIERIELHGSFATGGRIVMTPPGQEAIELRIADAVEPVLFVDEANLDDVVVRTTHRVDRVGNERSRVTYR